MKKVIQLDSLGYFVGITTADESPLEPGVYHLPAGAIEAPNPPDVADGARARWVGDAWVVVLPEPEPEPEPEPLPYQTAAEAKTAVVRWIDSLTGQIISQYPVVVRERWGIEELAARAVKSGSPSDDQLELIRREGATKGRTPLEHADRVIMHAMNFRAIADEVNTLFLSVDGQLDAATEPAQYSAIIDEAKAVARPLAESFGLTV